MTEPHQVSGIGAANLAGFRLVTLCGSVGSKYDAMRDYQDILEPLLSARGMDVRPVDLGDWSLVTMPRVLAAIAGHRPDGILMQYPTFAFGHSLGPVGLGMVQRIAPIMVMLHEFVAAHVLRKAAVGALLLRADRIGVTAKREREYLCRWYPWLKSRINTIPIASNIPGRAWTPVRPPRVVYFGQLRPEKGIEEFIAYKHRIATKVPEAVFQIIGAVVPSQAEYAKSVHAAAAAQGIDVILDLERDEVAAALAMATVALLPFPGGASPRRGSLLAASACGVPIVTKIGDDTPPELLPYLETACSDDELISLTVRYLQDEEARVRSHRRSTQLDRWIGWEETVDLYIRVFREFLTMGGAKTSSEFVLRRGDKS